MKQYPTGITSTTLNNYLVFACPEAPFEMIGGQFQEQNLAALTPEEIVQELVNYVNVLQGNVDWFGVDLGGGYFLLQLHDSYNGFQFADACGICATGTTGAGIDLYWVYNSAPTGTPDLQDNNFLSFADNWNCTDAAGETLCLGTLEGGGGGGDTCDIVICNDILVPCQGGEPSFTFSERDTAFILDGPTNTLVPNAFFYSFTDDSQFDFQLQQADYLFKNRAILPCCDPNTLNLQIENAAWGGGTVTVSQPDPITFRLDLSNGSWVVITCTDFQNPMIITGGLNWVAPYYISNSILIHGESPTGQLNFTVDGQTLTFEFALYGDCIPPAGFRKTFYIA